MDVNDAALFPDDVELVRIGRDAGEGTELLDEGLVGGIDRSHELLSTRPPAPSGGFQRWARERARGGAASVVQARWR